MLFDEKTDMFKVISVLELDRGEECATAIPRDFHSFSLRLKGDADFTLPNKKIHIKSDDILYIPCNVGYKIKHTEEHLIVIHFETNNDDVIRDFFSFTPRNPQVYKTLFEEILVLWNRTRTINNYAASSLFYSILDKIHKEVFSNTSSSNENLRDVFDFIHNNYCDVDITVPVLAEIYGTSETYFRKVFKNTTGTSPLKYINSLRLKYAEELLWSGYYPVKDIAERVGFSDSKYFSRLFKQYKKISPSRLTKL